MNIRKILNFPTKEQKFVLLNDIKKIMEGCDSIASIEWKEQKENQYAHDSQCPKCKNKTNIVDKIRHVQGNGNINGDFKFGFGSIDGSLNIDTNEVNHCNKCGHEWKKFKTKYVSKTEIIKVVLNYLGDIYADKEKTKKHSWKHKAIKVFDDSYAEAIYMLVKKYDHYIRKTPRSFLNLTILRDNYKTIFNKIDGS